MISQTICTTILLICSTFSVTSAFSPTHLSSRSTERRISVEKLRLHPDQAPELEAAACEMLKAIEKHPEDEIHTNMNANVDYDHLDDTKDMGADAMSLSAASAMSSSQPAANHWWSQTFANLITRGN